MAQTSGGPDDLDTEQAYRLRPGDNVRVMVFDEPDLAVEQTLDPEGIIIVPLLGRTKIGGLNLRQAESHLEQEFIDNEYLISPQVTLAVVQYAPQVFYIFGEVRNPGAKTFPSGRRSLDILEAITLAGDMTQYAKKSEVILRRPIPGTNTEERTIIDLEKLIRGDRGGQTATVEVFPDDIIFIPERMF